MKKFTIEFLKRGALCAAGGPIVLAVIYFFLGRSGTVESLSVGEVAIGILTSTLLAFVAAGISAVYQVDKLPVFMSTFIHGAVLYAAYVSIYLINGWLKANAVPFLIFTGIFIVGYALIWVIVYVSTKASARKLNSKIKESKK